MKIIYSDFCYIIITHVGMLQEQQASKENLHNNRYTEPSSLGAGL